MPFTRAIWLSVALLLFLVAGCNGVPPTETITKEGRLYKIGADKLYTGTVVGYAREGYRKEKMK
jgi:hypothetical protein